jgi:hypothetical protein
MNLQAIFFHFIKTTRFQVSKQRFPGAVCCWQLRQKFFFEDSKFAWNLQELHHRWSHTTKRFSVPRHEPPGRSRRALQVSHPGSRLLHQPHELRAIISRELLCSQHPTQNVPPVLSRAVYLHSRLSKLPPSSHRRFGKHSPRVQRGRVLVPRNHVRRRAHQAGSCGPR